MNTEILKKINSFNKVELSEVNVELGLIQDIMKDVDSVATSISSIKPVILKLEELIGKNIKAVADIDAAILKVQNSAKELGAESFLKELERPAIINKNFTKTLTDLKKFIESAGSVI